MVLNSALELEGIESDRQTQMSLVTHTFTDTHQEAESTVGLLLAHSMHALCVCL